jgi:hypothetical protein
MKHGTGHILTHVSDTPIKEEKEEKKRGRPSKEEARRHKLAMADSSIRALVEDKPTRNKIRDYLERRIMELDAEKR